MLYYCKTPNGNFGDDLNPWLWPQLAPEVCRENDGTLFVGIGTIFNHKIPAAPRKVVFGAGGGNSGPQFRLDERWKVYCVRGPLTAARFRLDPSLAVTDSALLVRQRLPATEGKKFRVSFMPHLQSVAFADWKKLCAQIGFHCIDPRAGVEHVLRELQATELLLAEAMHGAIVADALRVPWIPVRVYGKFFAYKWQDWTQSVRVPFQPVDLPPIYEHPPLGWKKVNYFFKKNLAGVGMGPEAWNRLGYRRSSPAEIDRILEALQKIPGKQTTFLSDEAWLLKLEARLLEKLADLRAHWQPSA